MCEIELIDARSEHDRRLETSEESKLIGFSVLMHFLCFISLALRLVGSHLSSVKKYVIQTLWDLFS
jgi:hypothetical protein